MRYHFRFMAWRKLFLGLSALLILITIVSLATRGMNFGTDFTGGVVLRITTPHPTTVAAVHDVLDQQGQTEATIQQVVGSQETFELTMAPMPDSGPNSVDSVFSALNSALGPGVTKDSTDETSPTIGKELRNKAILAVLIATALMTAYLGLRFQVGSVGTYSGLKFALAAVIALLHDITLTVGLFSVFHLEVNAPFVAAVLTVYGYSMNDTIIVFDRIRERLASQRREGLAVVIDTSINQVLSRTIATVATVLLALLAVYGFSIAGQSRELTLALLVGVSFGTYSSIFIASPIFLWLANRPDPAPARATGRAARV